MQSWLCEKQRIVRTWSSITSTVMRLKYSLAIHTRVTNNTFHSKTAICWIFCRLNKFERKFLRNRCKKYDSRRKIKYIERCGRRRSNVPSVKIYFHVETDIRLKIWLKKNFEKIFDIILLMNLLKKFLKMNIPKEDSKEFCSSQNFN